MYDGILDMHAYGAFNEFSSDVSGRTMQICPFQEDELTLSNETCNYTTSPTAPWAYNSIVTVFLDLLQGYTGELVLEIWLAAYKLSLRAFLGVQGWVSMAQAGVIRLPV